MTAARRLAAILAADVGGARASGWHVRKPRQPQLPSKAVTSVITGAGLRGPEGLMKAASEPHFGSPDLPGL
jgi:hypothetical protein